MKIRSGFVANSSSSSFIIAGECFEYDEESIVKEFNKHNFKLEDLPYSDGFETLEDYIEDCGNYELAELIAKASDKDYVVDSEEMYGFGDG